MADDILDLGERIAEMAAHLDAATHTLLTSLREFDTKRGWYKAGAKDCAEWLSWRVGWSRGTARQHVAVAQKLGELPLIDEALRTGELSYSKVRAMTRVATTLNEKLLLESARLMTGAQLERVCRKYATIQRHDAEESPQQSNRYVRKRYLDDGMVRIEAVLHPDEAAIVWAALDRAATELSNANRAESAPAEVESVPAETTALVMANGETVSAGTSGRAATETVSAETTAKPSLAASSAKAIASRGVFDRADALVVMARQFIAGDERLASPVEMIVTVPIAALGPGAGISLENLGTLPDGEGIAPDTCCRLACEAGVRFVVEDETGNPLSVGRRTRALPTALKRAVLERDQRCCFPGCQNRLFLQGHHMRHWAHGGATTLDNVCALCDRHHRFVHEFGYRIELGADGRPVVFDPQGRLVKEVPDRFRGPDLGWTTLQRDNAALGITASTNAPGWDGQPVAYLDVVGELSRADQRWYVEHPLYGVDAEPSSTTATTAAVEPDGYVEPIFYDLGPDEWSELASTVSAETTT